MVALFLAAVFLAPPQGPDTVTFRDAATAELYARARVRHIRQDSLVKNYRAVVRTRLDASAGRSRFARQTTLMAHEAVAEVRWQAPNDLRVKVLGTRAALPVIRILEGFGGNIEDDAKDELRRQLLFDRPWFIPRALSDSIRVMGVPDHAALHPFADDALRFYRFAITDSLLLATPNRPVRAYQLRVEPKQYGPSLVAGNMWLDANSGDVVRFDMIFLGDFVWESPREGSLADSARARQESAQAERYLTVEAQVEYALVDQQYWMPYRQLLAVTAEIPWFVNVAIPARAVTTFSEYTVNTNPPIVFHVPEEDLVEGDAPRRRVVVKGSRQGVAVDVEDEADEQRFARGYYRAGRWREGRWEMDVPPADSLLAHEWDTQLDATLGAAEERRLREAFADLSRLEEQLPLPWTGRRRLALAWENAAEIMRFNRAQGLSVGVGYRFRPGVDFTSVLATARFGFSDLRPTGTLTWRRDGPAGRWDVRGFRSVTESESWSRGLGIGNSLNALLVGNDDADYYLTTGGGLSYQWNHGLLRDVEVALSYERHESMEVATGSIIADVWGNRAFQENPAVNEGWFAHGRLARRGRWGPVSLAPGVELLAGEAGSAGRAWASVGVPFTVLGLGGAVQLKTAITRGDSLPQLASRLGGPHTVRGYTYGVRQGRELWSAQLDVALSRSRLLAPVVFFDIGDTFTANPLIGAGAGLSLLNGLMRFNLSKGLRPVEALRFDLLFRAPR
jgi:hypothetical protein